jgi:hypothetical protein
MNFLTELGIISTGLAVGGAFLGLGWRADGLISQQASDDLSSYLLDPRRERSIKTAYLWPKIFIEFFDHIFGEKHLTFKCFYRSAIASITAVIICAAAIIIVVEKSLAGDGVHEILQAPIEVYIYLSIFFISFNVLPDYISLLETRIVIDKIRKSKSAVMRFFWIMLDVAATLFIFWIATYTSILILSNILPGIAAESFFGMLELIINSIWNPASDIDNEILAIFLWTTFFTSIWVWLYVASQLVTRLISPLRKSVHFVQYLLPIDTKPLLSVCMVMAVISCVFTWIILAPFGLASIF